MLPDCIKILVENLNRKPETAMVYGNMRLINKKGRRKIGHFWFEKPLFSGNVCFPENTQCINTYANNTIGAAFMTLILRVLKNVMTKAVELKEENELTI